MAKKMENEKKYPILVVCALIVRDGNVLLERRAPGTSIMEHKWDLPGGKVELGELPKAALIRKIKEELGIDIDAYCLIDNLYISQWGDTHWVLAVYRCNWISGNLTLTDDLTWKPIAALTEVDTMAPDLRIIRDAVTGR